MSAPNWSTHHIEAWLTNDGSFVRAAREAALRDPDGTGAFRDYVHGLVRYGSDNGRRVTSHNDRDTLTKVAEAVDLSEVDWKFARDSVADVDV